MSTRQIYLFRWHLTQSKGQISWLAPLHFSQTTLNLAAVIIGRQASYVGPGLAFLQRAKMQLPSLNGIAHLVHIGMPLIDRDDPACRS